MTHIDVECIPITRPLVDPEWVERLNQQIDSLCEMLRDQFNTAQLDLVKTACYFAAEAHYTQRRKSGEPYVFHPIEVAKILAQMHFDHQTIIAALLHDVIEDTQYSKEQISTRFGQDVADLVDGVTKLTQMPFSSKLEAQAENFQKMFLAMTKDIRVIIIKLADRLHNMRTLDAMEGSKRRRIARETLDIYARIANRLGMNTLRLELEDLGFQHLYPYRYQVLRREINRMTGSRRELISQLETRIRHRLQEEGIKARVMGRTKSLWSIYKKMREKKSSFKEIHDIYGVRVLIDTVDTCYRVLGVLHGLYKPLIDRFKDYIAIPKANGYQSLHTTLFGPGGLHIEAQIRTHEMDLIAEAGISAHWLYKFPEHDFNSTQKRAREWLHKILDMQRRAGNSLEFLENLKVDLFPGEIYVFTPRGEIIELPRGATAVDFAYAIHSDVGNTCIGAKVDRRVVPLHTPLANGQTVEITIAPTGRPNPAWLSFVVTAKARTSIRHYLKNLQRNQAILFGKRLLEKALFISNINDLPAERLQRLAHDLNVSSFDDILADIGLGNRLAPLIAKRLATDHESPTGLTPRPDPQKPLCIRGTEGMVVNFGKCCYPLPGDPIMGYLSTGRGIMIHRDRCKNVADYKNNPEKWIEVEWEHDLKTDFSTALRVDVKNKRGVLARIAAIISDMEANIENVNSSERDGATAILDFILTVRDRQHLLHIIQKLRLLPETLRVARH